MKKPQFIIGGAARSATTWLCNALKCNPNIFLPKNLTPEPKFFSRDAEFEKGFDYYCEKWFSDAPEGLTLGEKSTSYLETTGCAARIHADLPDLKLIFLLRNPADRAYSNYLWSKYNGFETETFEQAVELEEERKRQLPPELETVMPYAYVERGFYSAQIAEYLALYPKSNILCLKSEEIGRDPNALMKQVFEFLEVEAIAFDFNTLGVVNAAPDEVEDSVSPEMREKLDAVYAADNKKLVELLGGDFSLW